MRPSTGPQSQRKVPPSPKPSWIHPLVAIAATSWISSGLTACLLPEITINKGSIASDDGGVSSDTSRGTDEERTDSTSGGSASEDDESDSGDSSDIDDTQIDPELDDSTSDGDESDDDVSSGTDTLPPDSTSTQDPMSPPSTDLCPTDPNKLEPGACGCGTPDTLGANDELLCASLDNALMNRYQFLGTDTLFYDTRGSSHGQVNGTRVSNGTLVLSGSDNEYGDLPNDLLSGLFDASLELWITWHGGEGRQRIFDFGSNSAPEGTRGSGTEYFFLTPANPGAVFAGFQVPDEEQVRARGRMPLQVNTLSHVVVVFDDTRDELRLYVNGELDGAATLPHSLRDITYQNNWLGRSQWSVDPPLAGSFEEFRIYEIALSSEQVTLSYTAGPDPEFFSR